MKINQEITTEQQRRDLIKELQNLEIKKEISKSWEDLGRVEGYYVNGLSDIDDVHNIKGTYVDSIKKNRNTFATKAQAESSRAYAMLTQLMKETNGDWVADWSNFDQDKYCIYREDDSLEVIVAGLVYVFIALKSEAIRDEFLANHEESIKTFYQIK